MNTASILIKTDIKVKQEAQRTAKEMGLSLSAVVTRLLKEYIKYKTITFRTKELEEIPNARTRALLKQAQEDRKAGRASPVFDSAEDAIAWLHKQGI